MDISQQKEVDTGYFFLLSNVQKSFPKGQPFAIFMGKNLTHPLSNDADWKMHSIASVDCIRAPVSQTDGTPRRHSVCRVVFSLMASAKPFAAAIPRWLSETENQQENPMQIWCPFSNSKARHWLWRNAGNAGYRGGKLSRQTRWTSASLQTMPNPRLWSRCLHMPKNVTGASLYAVWNDYATTALSHYCTITAAMHQSLIQGIIKNKL